VASIAAGMITVLTITTLNAVARDMTEPLMVLGFAFPMDTDYIAIPAVIASVSVLVVVSLLTPKPAEEDWREFVEG
jgi:Na+/proline symporter